MDHLKDDVNSKSNREEVMRVQLLTPNATLPAFATPLSAGLDLCAAERQVLLPGKSTFVRTGIAICPPKGTYCRIAPKSSLAFKDQIWINAGVIDADYTGEVLVLMTNCGVSEFAIVEGSKIAQIICEKISQPRVVQVFALTETLRGNNGFGSTGP